MKIGFYAKKIKTFNENASERQSGRRGGWFGQARPLSVIV